MSTESYADEVAALRQRVDVLELRDADARVAVVPAWQARVATTCTNATERGFGWLNHDFIASGESHEKIHAYGGEDRIWLGPEAGQFSLFHDPSDPFDVAHWRTPALIDREAFTVVDANDACARFRHEARVQNWSRTSFELGIERTIRVLARDEISGLLRTDLDDAIRVVGVESINTLRNLGAQNWSRDTGIPVLWMIGMFRASDAAEVVIPYRNGPQEQLGQVVNDRYFGAVPEDRLRVTDDAIHFRADAKHRSKIGISPLRALPFMGSFDAERCALTIVNYDLDPDGSYVNQMWEMQDQPFVGDALHSYNDGRWSEDMPQLGAFYELEASSPARALAPGEAVTQHHRTMHFEGAESELEALAQNVLGTTLRTSRA